MALHIKDGEFISKDPDVVKETETHMEVSESQTGSGEVDELHDALQKANEQIAELRLEVENLKVQGKAAIKKFGNIDVRSMMKNWQQKTKKKNSSIEESVQYH